MIGGLLASTIAILVMIPVAYSSATGLVARMRSRQWLDDGAADGERPATA